MHVCFLKEIIPGSLLEEEDGRCGGNQGYTCYNLNISLTFPHDHRGNHHSHTNANMHHFGVSESVRG